MTQTGEGRQDAQREATRGGRGQEVFELKSASLSALTLVLRSADLAALSAALQERLGETPDVFNHEPVVLELSQLPAAASADAAGQLSLTEAAALPDFAALVQLLARFRLQAVAVSGATAEQLAAAQAAGLAEAETESGGVRVDARAAEPAREQVREVVREVIVEQVREVRVPAEAPRTVIVDKPLRSGQQVYAKGADLVVMALVNHGAEVIADGNIHVYAPLRGKAIAGARGNTEARIFAASLEAELIAIAGIYRTTENPLPEQVLGKAAQVRLEGEKLVMEALKL